MFCMFKKIYVHIFAEHFCNIISQAYSIALRCILVRIKDEFRRLLTLHEVAEKNKKREHHTVVEPTNLIPTVYISLY